MFNSPGFPHAAINPSLALRALNALLRSGDFCDPVGRASRPSFEAPIFAQVRRPVVLRCRRSKKRRTESHAAHVVKVARDITALRTHYGGVLVPTMGALHAGHLALIERARQIARSRRPPPPVVVSVFVNPTQFNERADFENYPRQLERDVEWAGRLGVDCLFAPDVETMYPPEQNVPVGELPAVATEPGLEDAHRPGHFAGVCQVVRRLFQLTRPASVIFGEKDWQQLQLVRAMTRREELAVEIIAHPTVREADGVALSSRNKLLAPDQRKQATAFPRALEAASQRARVAEAQRAMQRTLEQAGVEVEYAVVRDAASLSPLPAEAGPGDLDSPARALLAGRVGSVRLIDNAPWPIEAPIRPDQAAT